MLAFLSGVLVAMAATTTVNGRARYLFLESTPNGKTSIFLKGLGDRENGLTTAWFVYFFGDSNVSTPPEKRQTYSQVGFNCTKGLDRPVYNASFDESSSNFKDAVAHFGSPPLIPPSLKGAVWSIVCGSGIGNSVRTYTWDEAVEAARAVYREGQVGR
jgi:hypothetical protein